MMRAMHNHLHRRRIGFALALAVVLAALSSAGCRKLAPEILWTRDFHRERIHWMPYEAGLAKAKAEGKPVCLVFYADWCAHCQAFAANVTQDPHVVEAAEGFVFIHVNADDRPEVVRKYPARGVPAVFFLNQDGALLKGAHAPNLTCKRFLYNEKDSADFLAGMELAKRLAREGDPSADPLASTERVCAPKHGANACTDCIRTRCCAEVVQSLSDVAGFCASRGPALAAFTDCLRDRCPECPNPKPKERSP